LADDGAFDSAVAILAVLGDRTRLRMLAALAEGETYVGQLQARLGLDQPSTSFHLTRLRRAGLVQTRRDRQWTFYALDPDALAAAGAAIERVLNPSA
jgi:DNA-binding transcriptional ArsR family regulator